MATTRYENWKDGALAGTYTPLPDAALARAHLVALTSKDKECSMYVVALLREVEQLRAFINREDE